jgi:hypothetical protein
MAISIMQYKGSGDMRVPINQLIGEWVDFKVGETSRLGFVAGVTNYSAIIATVDKQMIVHHYFMSMLNITNITSTPNIQKDIDDALDAHNEAKFHKLAYEFRMQNMELTNDNIEEVAKIWEKQ